MLRKVSIPAGGVFQVLNLKYYTWRWVSPWELLEVDFGGIKVLYEVKKLESDEDEVIVVVFPIKQYTVCEEDGR